MAVLGTIITRFLPFVLFPESKKPPRIVDYLGNVLPYAMIGLLVVYSLKNVNPLAESHGIPEAIAIAVIVILHIWKRNMLLSIAGGTALYIWYCFSLFLFDYLFCKASCWCEAEDGVDVAEGSTQAFPAQARSSARFWQLAAMTVITIRKIVPPPLAAMHY